MKRNLFFPFIFGLTMLFAPRLAAAQDSPATIRWYSLEEALELQKRDPKPILIDLYTDWCGYCKRLDAYTFSNKEIVRYISSTFHAVKFNAEQRESITYSGHEFKNSGEGARSPHELAVALTGGKLSYPTLVYLAPDSQLITSVPGYYSPSQLEPILHFIGEEAYKSTSWEEFSKTFKGKL